MTCSTGTNWKEMQLYWKGLGVLADNMLHISLHPCRNEDQLHTGAVSITAQTAGKVMWHFTTIQPLWEGMSSILCHPEHPRIETFKSQPSEGPWQCWRAGAWSVRREAEGLESVQFLSFRKKIKGNPSAVFKILEKSDPGSSQRLTVEGQRQQTQLQKVKFQLF